MRPPFNASVVREVGSGPRATLQDVYSAGLSGDADGVTIG
jgi:hypothetical protein